MAGICRFDRPGDGSKDQREERSMTHVSAGRVAGKKALITGAAGGIGSATARMLARHGARVFLTDLDAAKVGAVAGRINAEMGARVAWSAVQDVTEEARWPTVLESANEAMEGLSVLVNNAGVGVLGGVEKLELADWRRAMSVNLDAAYYGCKYALPLLRRHQPASIVNISSLAAIKINPDFTAYNAAKAGVAALTKSVAIDCARQGVDLRCNSVHPAFTRTGIIDYVLRKHGEEEGLRKLARIIPLNRLGEPDDIAYAVLYLASDESRFVTATELRLDGGASAV
jgi:NAD(P)-dependent dehydrogenase (short-subunit alcohol dehydrogenase family)